MIDKSMRNQISGKDIIMNAEGVVLYTHTENTSLLRQSWGTFVKPYCRMWLKSQEVN